MPILNEYVFEMLRRIVHSTIPYNIKKIYIVEFDTKNPRTSTEAILCAINSGYKVAWFKIGKSDKSDNILPNIDILIKIKSDKLINGFSMKELKDVIVDDEELLAMYNIIQAEYCIKSMHQ